MLCCDLCCNCHPARALVTDCKLTDEKLTSNVINTVFREVSILQKECGIFKHALADVWLIVSVDDDRFSMSLMYPSQRCSIQVLLEGGGTQPTDVNPKHQVRVL